VQRSRNASESQAFGISRHYKSHKSVTHDHVAVRACVLCLVTGVPVIGYISISLFLLFLNDFLLSCDLLVRYIEYIIAYILPETKKYPGQMFLSPVTKLRKVT